MKKLIVRIGVLAILLFSLTGCLVVRPYYRSPYYSYTPNYPHNYYRARARREYLELREQIERDRYLEHLERERQEYLEYQYRHYHRHWRWWLLMTVLKKD